MDENYNKKKLFMLSYFNRRTVKFSSKQWKACEKSMDEFNYRLYGLIHINQCSFEYIWITCRTKSYLAITIVASTARYSGLNMFHLSLKLYQRSMNITKCHQNDKNCNSMSRLQLAGTLVSMSIYSPKNKMRIIVHIGLSHCLWLQVRP